MTETNEPIKIHRGLKGVYFDRSPCTFIDGRIGELRYRGYSITTSPSIRVSKKLRGSSCTASCRRKHSSQHSTVN